MEHRSYAFENPPTDYAEEPIFWGNEDSAGTSVSAQILVQSGDPCVEFSDVQGCWAGTCAAGNSCSDPLFADADGPDDIPGTSDDNLRLLAESPCIDVGDNSVVNAVLDLDGNERILDGDGDRTATVDMGAYEFVPPPPVIPALSPWGIVAMGMVLLAAGAAVQSRGRPARRSTDN